MTQNTYNQIVPHRKVNTRKYLAFINLQCYASLLFHLYHPRLFFFQFQHRISFYNLKSLPKDRDKRDKAGK